MLMLAKLAQFLVRTGPVRTGHSTYEIRDPRARKVSAPVYVRSGVISAK